MQKALQITDPSSARARRLRSHCKPGAPCPARPAPYRVPALQYQPGQPAAAQPGTAAAVPGTGLNAACVLAASSTGLFALQPQQLLAYLLFLTVFFPPTLPRPLLPDLALLISPASASVTMSSVSASNNPSPSSSIQPSASASVSAGNNQNQGNGNGNQTVSGSNADSSSAVNQSSNGNNNNNNNNGNSTTTGGGSNSTTNGNSTSGGNGNNTGNSSPTKAPEPTVNKTAVALPTTAPPSGPAPGSAMALNLSPRLGVTALLVGLALSVLA